MKEKKVADFKEAAKNGISSATFKGEKKPPCLQRQIQFDEY